MRQYAVPLSNWMISEMRHRLLLPLTLGTLLFVSLACCLYPRQLHAQNSSDATQLSADETLTYLRQKLQTYGLRRWNDDSQCELQQTIDISSDRHFIIYSLTDEAQGQCGRKTYKLPVTELRIGGKRGRWEDTASAGGAAANHKLETGDWAQSYVDTGQTLVFFACKYSQCARSSGAFVCNTCGASYEAGFYLSDVPEEQVSRISRAVVHLVDALQKEPANAQDRNDPFAK
jgi:hypothetical protein